MVASVPPGPSPIKEMLLLLSVVVVPYSVFGVICWSLFAPPSLTPLQRLADRTVEASRYDLSPASQTATAVFLSQYLGLALVVFILKSHTWMFFRYSRITLLFGVGIVLFVAQYLPAHHQSDFRAIPWHAVVAFLVAEAFVSVMSSGPLYLWHRVETAVGPSMLIFGLGPLLFGVSLSISVWLLSGPESMSSRCWPVVAGLSFVLVAFAAFLVTTRPAMLSTWWATTAFQYTWVGGFVLGLTALRQMDGGVSRSGFRHPFELDD